MPSWRCIRAMESVRLKFRQDEKVARRNWRSNPRSVFALIHGRGMKRLLNQRAEDELEILRYMTNAGAIFTLFGW
jgi:hypothetical protein